jgi:hypothetical protein
VTIALAPEERPQSETLLELALRKVGQLTCRHSYLVVRLRHRMFLQCSYCGRETEGFQVGSIAKGPRAL